MKFDNKQFRGLYFMDELSGYNRWIYIWTGLSQKLTRFTSIIAPVIHKGSKGWSPVSIDCLAKALGITDPQASTIIGLHKHRLRKRAIAILAVLLPLWLPFTLVPLSFSFGWLARDFGIVVVVFAFVFVYFSAVTKLCALIVDKHYADSLCVLTALFVLCEMTRDDMLSHPEKRRSLLHRIEALARLTRLLGANFPGGCESTRRWAFKHFRNLELYVREIERAVIAPTNETVTNLRDKMAVLIELYLFGNYGEDLWNGNSPDHENVQESKVNRWVIQIQRVMGILIPGVLLIVIGVYPNIASSIGVETNTLFLISITWFILALDAILGLGIVDKVVKTAKEIRELK